MLLRIGFLLILCTAAFADCPPGTTYSDNFNKCYQFYTTPLAFLAAERQCNGIGGNLVAIQNGFENNFVAGLAAARTGQTPNFYIGANQLLSSSWSWTANTSMLYANWASGQPGAAYPCGIFGGSDSKWITAACSTGLPFVCQVDPNAFQPGNCPTQGPAQSCGNSSCSYDNFCDSGYNLFVGNCKCYKYIQGIETWIAANTTCSADGAMLATIDSYDLDVFLTSLPGIAWLYDSAWIGLQCTNTTGCVWADGSSVSGYTNFEDFPTESNYVLNSSGSFYRGQWSPQNGSFTYSMICQKDSIRASDQGTLLDDNIRHVYDGVRTWMKP